MNLNMNEILYVVINEKGKIQYWRDDMNIEGTLCLPSTNKELLESKVEVYNEFHDKKWKVIKIKIEEI